METEVIRWRQSSGRRKTFIVLAALFGVLSGTLLFGWISLIFGWFAGGVDQIHRVHNIGGGALFGILVAFGFLFQAWNPERKIALMHQLGGAILGIIVAAVIAQDWAILGFAALVAIPTGALWVLHPARTSSIIGGDRSLTLLTLTLIAVIPR